MADWAQGLCQPGPKLLLLCFFLALHFSRGFSLGVFWGSIPHSLAQGENGRPTESSKGVIPKNKKKRKSSWTLETLTNLWYVGTNVLKNTGNIKAGLALVHWSFKWKNNGEVGQIREGSKLVPEKPYYSDEHTSGPICPQPRHPESRSCQHPRAVLAIRGRHASVKLVRPMDHTRMPID